MKKIFIFIYFVLLGIGRNTPDQMFVYSGVGLIDIFTLIAFIYILQKRDHSVLIAKYRYELIAFTFFFVFASFSAFVNTFKYTLLLSDLFELFRYILIPVYLIVISIFFIRERNLTLLGFFLGVAYTGLIAYLNPRNLDILGTVQLFNPNVIGTIMVVSAAMATVFLKNSSIILKSFLIATLLFLSFYTFSKSSWLIAILVLYSFFVIEIFYSKNIRDKVTFSLIFVVPVFSIIALNFDLIYMLFYTKYLTTDFGLTAAEGNSFQARWGLIYSSIIIWTENPIFGVGISNWEQAHIENQMNLGSMFYLDDNPNSAFFYVLSCMGIIPFLIFIYVFFQFSLYVITALHGLGIGYHISIILIMVFFLTGNIQVEMLKAYYFWFAYALFKTEALKLKSLY